MKIVEVNCPVCDNSEYKFLFRDHNHRDKIDCSGSYVQCKKCSLVYLRERPPWEEIVNFYSSVYGDHTPNAGQVDALELRRQAEIPFTKWKQILRKFRFRPHSWPLESVQDGNKRLLDLGCGSGVLAIAANLLGAEECEALDFDRKAVEIARHNVERNGAHEVRVEEADLREWRTERQYEVVVANLFADVLQASFGTIRRTLGPGSAFILSGVLREQWTETEEAARTAGLAFEIVKKKGKWISAKGGMA